LCNHLSINCLREARTAVLIAFSPGLDKTQSKG
jgi:hypothetical protein